MKKYCEYSKFTKIIWTLENACDFLSTKLQCFRVDLQMKDIAKLSS